MTTFPLVIAAVFGAIFGSFLNCLHLPAAAWWVDRLARFDLSAVRTGARVVRQHSDLQLSRAARPMPQLRGANLVAYSARGAGHGRDVRRLAGGYYGPGWLLASRLAFGCALIVLFAIDLEHHLLLNVITLPGIVVGFAFSFFTEPGWVASLIGLLMGGGALWGVAEAYYLLPA